MVKIRINRGEFQAGFKKGFAVGLVTLLLALGTYVELSYLGHIAFIILLLVEWLLPAFFVYYRIKTNGGRVGFLASHYCIFLIGILIMLLGVYS